MPRRPSRAPLARAAASHCYSRAMREGVVAVMRFAGPRMIYRHPWLAVRHLIDGLRPAPVLPRKRVRP